MAEIKQEDLTEATLEGGGVFDLLMRANNQHLLEEYKKNRIKGPEYAQVYLGGLQAAMQHALQFLLEKQRADAQADLIRAQIDTEVAQQGLIAKQTDQVDAEIGLTIAQTGLTDQQKTNLVAEALNIPKQGQLLDKQIEVADAEITLKGNQGALIGEQVNTEIKNNKEGGLIDQQIATAKAQAELTEQQVLNLVAEALNIPKQGLLIDAQVAKVGHEGDLIGQQTINAVTEELVLVAQECKLRGEYDLILEQVLKTTAESALLQQRMKTEKAQTSGAGVDADSVLGRQKALHSAQAEGFIRDAEQKAAKIMVDSWNVRRTTDEDTQANAANRLSDTHVGRVMEKLLSGVNA